MFFKFNNKYLLLLCLFTLISCSSVKYVQDGEYLLDQVKIISYNPDIKPSELKPYLQQQPNFKVFGIFKWPLYLYNMSGRKENRWINKQLRSMGEPPVLLDYDLAEQTAVQLKRYLSNKGYLNAQISIQSDTTRYKKAIMKYYVNTYEPYKISHYQTKIDDVRIDSIAHLQPPPASFIRSMFRSAYYRDYISLIQENMLFDRNILDKERQRITTLLRRNGYYAFNRDFIGYTADSSALNRNVDISLYIKPFLDINHFDTIDNHSHRQFVVNKVKIMTDYNPLSANIVDNDYVISDSVLTHNIMIYYGQNKHSIRPSVLQQGCYIVPGTLYNERSVEQTYSSFSSFNAFRYVSIKFEEKDSLQLDCTILTAPEKKQQIRFDLEGTNSAGDLGFASSMLYQHRNVFKGSELLSAKVRGGYEYLSSTNEQGNYWEFSGEASIHFPHFKSPFISNNFRRKIRASTEFNLSYDQQRRPEYYRSIVSGGWIYHWQNRMNALAKHSFKLLDINYVFLPYIEKSFKEKLPETTALYNYSDQFIVSTGYVYSYNNYDPLENRRDNYSLRFAFESAGNAMNMISRIINSNKDANGIYKLFGINYSQFMKADIDFARSLTIDTRNSVAFHLGFGVAYPYGNSSEIPFERRYYAGGANSNRGWNVRSLGPGSMSITDSTSFIHQTGDIRIDANLEYRSKLFWKIELAFFIDAGNIWTVKKYDFQPNGFFDVRKFYQELAVSYGLGVRLDFDYFLLRLDSGFKAYNPQERNVYKWALYHPNFKDNFAWHFAVGYPF